MKRSRSSSLAASTGTQRVPSGPNRETQQQSAIGRVFSRAQPFATFSNERRNQSPFKGLPTSLHKRTPSPAQCRLTHSSRLYPSRRMADATPDTPPLSRGRFRSTISPSSDPIPHHACFASQTPLEGGCWSSISSQQSHSRCYFRTLLSSLFPFARSALRMGQHRRHVPYIPFMLTNKHTLRVFPSMPFPSCAIFSFGLLHDSGMCIRVLCII